MSLTKKQQARVLKDFLKWSGGFLPHELPWTKQDAGFDTPVGPSAVNTYLRLGAPADLPRADLRAFLRERHADRPQPANDEDVRARPGPPVDSWRRLLAWLRKGKHRNSQPGARGPGSPRETRTYTETALDFVAKVLTDSQGFDDWRGHEFSEEWYELVRNGQKPLTVRSAREQIAEWAREWKEDSGETTPYDLREELEEYFEREGT